MKLKKLNSAILGLSLGVTLATSAVAEGSLQDVMKARGLTESDVLSAAKIYTPTGGRDEYLAFSSGGQSGHVIVLMMNQKQY